MVRWEERRGAADGSDPALSAPSAGTMSPPKGEGGGLAGGDRGLSEGGTAGEGGEEDGDPAPGPAKRDPPCLPRPRGSGTVLPAGGCGAGRHHRGGEGKGV